MLRRASRCLFVARNRTLLVESARALGKGATNPTIVGANMKGQAPQSVDPSGQAPLEFGKHTNESSMFAQAGAAWETMRKVGQTNPIEVTIEKFEDRYQAEGTGAEPVQKSYSSGPSLWERAKEAVWALKQSMTSDTQASQTSKRNDIIYGGKQMSEQQFNEKTLEEQEAIVAELRKQRPNFADDATGHRPWNWDMADDSIRNSTDGMGIIEPVGPTAADYEAREWSDTQVNDNLRAQKQKFTKRSDNTTQAADKDWQNVKDASNESWQNMKQAATENWQNTKDAASQNWQNAKQATNDKWQDAKQEMKENWEESTSSAKQNLREAKNALNQTIEQKTQSFTETKDAAKEDLRDTKEAAQQTWDDTKEVAKEGLQEAGKQLKKGFSDLKEGVKNLGEAAKEAVSGDSQKNISASPGRIEESYEELYNQPPGQGFRAAAERLTEKELKNAESTTRQEITKGESAEHGEKNAQVPIKKPTRYGDWEYGGRASDF